MKKYYSFFRTDFRRRNYWPESMVAGFSVNDKIERERGIRATFVTGIYNVKRGRRRDIADVYSFQDPWPTAIQSIFHQKSFIADPNRFPVFVPNLSFSAHPTLPAHIIRLIVAEGNVRDTRQIPGTPNSGQMLPGIVKRSYTPGEEH